MYCIGFFNEMVVGGGGELKGPVFSLLGLYSCLYLSSESGGQCK